MPASKKKGTTSQSVLSKSEPSASLLPQQQEFHQHLRAYAEESFAHAYQ